MIMYGVSATKVAISKTVEVMRMILSTPPTSASRSARVSCAVIIRCASPSRCITDRLSSEATVISPSPPSLIAIMITVRPKVDQWVPVSTVTRPVTQIAETAVNSASVRSVRTPSVVAAGSDSSTVNAPIIAVNTPSAIRDGVARVRLCSTRRHRAGRFPVPSGPVRRGAARPPGGRTLPPMAGRDRRSQCAEAYDRSGTRGGHRSATLGTLRAMPAAAQAPFPADPIEPGEGADRILPTGIVWDDALCEYDFGPFHPMAPIRLTLTRELARTAGLLDRPGVEIL